MNIIPLSINAYNNLIDFSLANPGAHVLLDSESCDMLMNDVKGILNIHAPDSSSDHPFQRGLTIYRAEG